MNMMFTVTVSAFSCRFLGVGALISPQERDESEGMVFFERAMVPVWPAEKSALPEDLRLVG